ncbi:hypothetical protein CPAV1605_1113 [seawater metagenome]|uniref:RING-type domain-containing protein n=1 Tax=seawater metagenome TaxID=1561972 RepID=A0A5E8CM46_9ZZZZ
MEYRYRNYNNPIIYNFNKNPVIYAWVFLKLSLIAITFTQEISLFLISQLLIHGYLFLPHAEIYESFYLMLEMISGIAGSVNDYKSNMTKATAWISLIPVVLIWTCAIFLTITYSGVRNLEASNSSNKYNPDLAKIKSQKIDQSTCPICFEDCVEIGYHVCQNNHFFHKECIQKWFNTNQFANKCPVCRQ